MKWGIASLAATLLFMPVTTSANESRRHDPNDTAGVLDVKRIGHGHRGDGQVWHKVVMRNRWGRKALRGDNEIRFHFSTDREDRFDEVHASIDVQDGKLKAWIFPYVETGDSAGVGPSERIRFVRTDRYSIKIFFDKTWVDRRNRYAWSVGTDYRKRSSRRCDRSCFDYAPGNPPDRIVHRI